MGWQKPAGEHNMTCDRRIMNIMKMVYLFALNVCVRRALQDQPVQLARLRSKCVCWMWGAVFGGGGSYCAWHSDVRSVSRLTGAHIYSHSFRAKKTKSSESKTIPYILNSLPCSWGPNKAISQTVFCAKQTVSVCVCVHEFICLSRVLRFRRRRRRLKAACRFVVLHCLCWPTRDFGQERRRR